MHQLATAVLPVPTPGDGIADHGAASSRGRRHHQADATAVHTSPRTGRLAVAVADGVGDSRPAATAATLVADHAVRVAAVEGRVESGLLAAHDLLTSAGGLARGDAAVVVALGPVPGDDEWRIAWVGDCRAYAWDGRLLRPLTTDHTVAAEMRAAGVRAGGAMEHVLTRSTRTLARPSAVGVATTRTARTLLLVSDGVHRALRIEHLASVLALGGTATDRAQRLVDAADRAGATDNATALVVAA